MARQTRQQRRQRRAQQQGGRAGAPPRPPASAPPGREEEPRPEPRRPDRPQERHLPGSGIFRFVQESIAELKKVEWPDQKAVVSGTAVVIIACVIVGTYLWLNDRLWQYVVHHVLLR
jgi:preprotein translocase SecE subunit